MKKVTFLLSLVLCLNLSAQVQFVAQASKYRVGVGERFSVTFSLNADAGNFQYPSFDGFTIVAGPSTQMSTSIINGNVSVNRSATFDVMALKTGTFTINSAKVVVNGVAFTTKPLTIEVAEGKTIVPDSPEDKASKLAYIKILTSKRKVYVGEAIPVRYVLYLKTNIGNYSSVQEPELSGFIRNDIQTGDPQRRTEIIDGEQVAVYDIAQFMLVAQRAGTVSPGKLMLQIPTAVPTGQRDWFGQPVTQTVNQVATAIFPTIEVMTLPESGKPTDFSGAVGDFRISANLSRNEVKANESVTLNIELSGSGNIQTAELPEPQIPATIERYDPKYKENFSSNLQGVKGNKRNEYLLIPRNKGTYKIPGLIFSFFNPTTRKYQTVQTQELTINVTDGPAPSAGGNPTTAPADQSAVQVVGEDILFIQTQAGEFKKPRQPFFRSTAYFAVLTGIIVFLILVPVVFQWRKTYRPDLVLQSQKNAGKQSRKFLREAGKHLKSADAAAFYGAIQQAMQKFFNYKFRLNPAHFSADTVQETLAKHNADAELQSEVKQLLQRADMARFAPLAQANMDADMALARQIINKLEQLA